VEYSEIRQSTMEYNTMEYSIVQLILGNDEYL